MPNDVQGEELVIDESQAAIEPLPNRDRAPLPEPPITPGIPHTPKPYLLCIVSRADTPHSAGPHSATLYNSCVLWQL